MLRHLRSLDAGGSMGASGGFAAADVVATLLMATGLLFVVGGLYRLQTYHRSSATGDPDRRPHSPATGRAGSQAARTGDVDGAIVEMDGADRVAVAVSGETAAELRSLMAERDLDDAGDAVSYAVKVAREQTDDD